jgi:hypothetical protein
MLTGLGHPGAFFLSGIKAFFIEHRAYNDLRRATEGGHDAAAYLYAILLQETMVVPLPTTPQRGA